MPGSTPTGLPYPLPTEPVSAGAGAIRSLAEALDGRPKTCAGYTPNFAYAANDSNHRSYTPAITTSWNDFAPASVFANGRFNAPYAGRFLVGIGLNTPVAGNLGLGALLNSASRLFSMQMATIVSADAVRPNYVHWTMMLLNANDTVVYNGYHSGGTAGTTTLSWWIQALGKPLGTLREAKALRDEIEAWQSLLPPAEEILG